MLGSAGDMRRRRPATAGQKGQASLELVAAVPMLILAGLVAVQCVAIGWAAWAAENAARAGARAMYVGRDGDRAAREALPSSLRKAVRITDRGGVRVRIRVPKVLAVAPAITVGSRAELEPADG